MLFIRGYYFLFSGFILALAKVGEMLDWKRQPQQDRQTEVKTTWRKTLVASLPLRAKPHVEPA